MAKLWICVLLVLAIAGCEKQVPPLAADAAAKLDARIEQMRSSLEQGDMAAFVAMMPPEILEMAGGTQPVVDLMSSDPAAIRTLTEARFGKRTDIVQASDGAGAVIPFDAPVYGGDDLMGHLSSCVLALSVDGGKTWHFVSATDQAQGWLKRERPRLLATLKPLIPADQLQPAQ